MKVSAGRRRGSGAGRPAAASHGAARSTGQHKPKGSRPASSKSAPDLAARLRERQRELRARVEDPHALIDIMRVVNSTLDPGTIAELTIARASRWVPATSWAVVSADGAGRLTRLADKDLPQDLAGAVAAIARWASARGEVFLSADVRDDPRVSDLVPVPAAAVAFPLSSRGCLLGALVALEAVPSSRPPRVGAALLRGIRVLLEPVAFALDNALRLKQTEALSVTDDLTQLYNSRYMNLVLRRETKLASRNSRPLSLLFLDLDGFKSVNDTHGHLAGSRALVEAAAVIRGTARETDVVARFGGDEFALVLPDTAGEGALFVGDRVRERVAAHRFLSADGLDVRLTVSVGVATLPDVGTTPEELIKAADVAMYRVKERGKNGIEVALTAADK